MKNIMKILLTTAFILSLSSQLIAMESLFVCKPCSREFIPVAEKVIEKLDLQDKLEIKGSSCLGACGDGVIKFRDEVYSGMDESMLESLLKDAFDIT